MGTVKVTFTLDRTTVSRLENAAQVLHAPKSRIVRDAVQEYHARMGKLSEQERLRMLRILDEISARAPTRRDSEVDAELAEIRAARRSGGRKTRT
jgi:predicted oxidoreductase